MRPGQSDSALSPLLLVRLLDIVEYGRYRQFMASAMLITSLGGFALAANLSYLIARSPARAAADITKTSMLMLVVGAISALLVATFRQWIVPEEISTVSLLLAVYVFLYLNLEVLVSYWLAQGNSIAVMAYTLIVTIWRLGTLFAAAIYFRELEMIFVTIRSGTARAPYGAVPSSSPHAAVSAAWPDQRLAASPHPCPCAPASPPHAASCAGRTRRVTLSGACAGAAPAPPGARWPRVAGSRSAKGQQPPWRIATVDHTRARNTSAQTLRFSDF